MMQVYSLLLNIDTIKSKLKRFLVVQNFSTNLNNIENMFVIWLPVVIFVSLSSGHNAIVMRRGNNWSFMSSSSSYGCEREILLRVMYVELVDR